MFELFDINMVSAFVEVVKNDGTLRHRIQEDGQFARLQKLGELLLNKSACAPADKIFLTLLTNTSQNKDIFLKTLPKAPTR